MALLTWVKREGPGRLGAMACPGRDRPIEEDLQRVKDEGVDQIISFVTDEEVTKEELGSEAEICDRLGIEYRRFPIVDHETPPDGQSTMDFLRSIVKDLKAGRTIALHCIQGRGRTTLIGASVLTLEGVDPDIAIQRVRGPRLVPVPDNKKQTEWIRALARRRAPRQRAVIEARQAKAQHRKRVVAAVIGAIGLTAIAAFSMRGRIRNWVGQ